MPDPPVPHDLVLFVHNPKAAGTTFYRAMRHMFRGQVAVRVSGSASEVWTAAWTSDGEDGGPKAGRPQSWRPPATIDEGIPDDIKLVRGLPYGAHERIEGRQVAYITILRDPVDRVISSYYHVHESVHHPMHRRLNDEGITLEDYVRGLEPDNLQTRLVSGRRHGKLQVEDLETAKGNLIDHFAVVGVTKAFDEFCVLCKMTLGWKRRPYYELANIGQVRPRTTEIPQETIDLIREHNRFDAELFETAVEVFEAHKRRLGDDFERELRRFRIGQRALSMQQRLRPSPELQRSFRRLRRRTFRATRRLLIAAERGGRRSARRIFTRTRRTTKQAVRAVRRSPVNKRS